MEKALFSLFKAYDIRGESPVPLGTEFASELGRSIIGWMAPKRVLLGRDMRLTSPELEQNLVSALVKGGVEVTRIGLCTTPMFNVLLGLADPKFDLGVMVTASHNPGKYNGFKLTLGDCLPVGLGNGLEQIRDLWDQNKKTDHHIPGKIINDQSAMDQYISHVIKLAELPKNMPEMKVVIDAGNGMGGMVADQLIQKCPWIKAEKLFFEPDGSFPNHEANPLKPETMETLKKRVKETGAQLGIAFDGDADRVGFVDENGEQVRGDVLTALFAKLELAKYPGGKVLLDTRASWSTKQAILNAGGQSEYCKVGHANIKKQMRKENALFAGEMSMHFYFKEFWNVECGDYAMLVLLKELAGSGRKFSSMWKDLIHYHHSGEINFEVKDTNLVLRNIQAQYAEQATSKIEIDGLRWEFGDPLIDKQAWWFSLRSSNTEPLLRLNLEAVQKSVMDQKLKELSQIIKQ